MKKFICVLLLICAVFFACETETDNAKLAIIDISNASNLFIAPASNGRTARNSGGDRLFKITEDGYIQEVSYYDENGKKATRIQTPSAIYNVNDDYVIICFDYNRNGYLTRKSDGAVFELPAGSSPGRNGGFKNSKDIQTDNNGGIYYKEGDYSQYPGCVTKLNVSNPNAIIKTDYLPAEDRAYAFAVNPEGHIVYDTSGSIRRIKMSNGRLQNIKETEGFYIGLDGKIKNLTQQTITTYTIDSMFNITENTTLFDDTPFNGSYGSFSLYSFSSNQAYLLYFENNVLIVSDYGSYVIEGDNPREIDFPIRMNDVSQSKSFYYVSGNNDDYQPIFLKINPITDEYQYIFEPNLYDVYSFSVSNDDVISFAALRMNDGAKVIGSVSSTGEVSILSTEFNTESIILERID